MPSYSFPPAMRKLVNELSKLPSIGERSAIRLAYHVLQGNAHESLMLAEALTNAVQRVQRCSLCHGLSEEPVCELCRDQSRERSLLCVVEKPADVLVIEHSGVHRGLYHVLHGLWSPMRGVGPEKTTLEHLFSRCADVEAGVRELIVATSTTVEGDATALFIAQSVEASGVRVSRIAQGLPKGGELDYTDAATLAHAIAGRQQLG